MGNDIFEQYETSDMIAWIKNSADSACALFFLTLDVWLSMKRGQKGVKLDSIAHIDTS